MDNHPFFDYFYWTSSARAQFLSLSGPTAVCEFVPIWNGERQNLLPNRFYHFFKFFQITSKFLKSLSDSTFLTHLVAKIAIDHQADCEFDSNIATIDR